MGGAVFGEALSAAYMAAIERDPLTQQERWVFLIMAHHARDRDGRELPARVYAGGWRVLCYEALCRTTWNASSKREVARAISGLKKRGLIAEYEDQDGRHKRYVVLPKGVGPQTTGGVVP